MENKQGLEQDGIVALSQTLPKFQTMKKLEEPCNIGVTGVK